jgi:hypothetical protein
MGHRRYGWRGSKAPEIPVTPNAGKFNFHGRLSSDQPNIICEGKSGNEEWCLLECYAVTSSQLLLCTIWGFHGGDDEECRLIGYTYPFRTSQETHYYFTTESSQLMLYTIWGFHGGDYEECRLLGYTYPFRTSQGTHYVSATESSQLMLCTIWGFHGGDYEECRLIGYTYAFRTSQLTHYL